MELFENEYVKLSIDESVPCLEWIGKNGFIPSEEFRLSEEKSLEFYRAYKKTYLKMEWFVDARYIDTIFPKDTQWLVDEILPQFAAAGLTKEAFVVSESALGKMTVDYYKSAAGQTIEIRMFDTVEAAKNWLKE
jgi:hypothetical protein